MSNGEEWTSPFKKELEEWQERGKRFQSEIEERSKSVEATTPAVTKGFFGTRGMPKEIPSIWETLSHPQIAYRPRFLTEPQEIIPTFKFQVRTPTGEYVTVANADEQYRLEQTYLKESVRNLTKAEWFAQFYGLAKNLTTNNYVKSIEDYLELFPDKGFLDPEDIGAAKSVIDELVSKGRPPVVPRTDIPDFISTPKEEVVKEFITEPTELPGPTTIHSLSIEEMKKALQSPTPIATLPSGMSDEELLAIASKLNIPEDIVKEIKEQDDAVKEISKIWSEHITMRADVLAGIREWETPQIEGFWKKALFTVSQPMTVVADIMQPYIENVNYPLQGFIWTNAQRLISGTQDLEKEFNQYKASGMATWEAYRRAWQEWDAPWGIKLASEMILDPMNLLPGLALSIPGKIALKIGLTSLGKGILAFNRGLWAATDIPFVAFKSTWKWLPKATSQVITHETEKFGSSWFAATTSYLNRIKGVVKTPDQFTVDDLAEAMTYSVKRAKEIPFVDGDVFADFGRYLMDFDALEPNNILKWSKSLKGKLTPDDANLAVVDEVNNILSDVISSGNIQQNTKRMAVALMVDDTPAIFRKLSTDIETYVGRYADRVANIINIGRTTKVNPVGKMLDTMITTQTAMISKFAESTYWKSRTMSGFVAGLVKQIDKLDGVIWRRYIDRFAVRPMAEANLGNVAYPYWNAFEAMFLSAFEGVIPRQMSQEAFLASVQGLKNIDFRLLTGGASDIAGMLGSLPGRPGVVSFLPGKIPEKILSKQLPKWLGGKDYLEWTGRKWIELSDLWGNAYRRNFTWGKANQFMVESVKGTTIEGKNLFSEFTRIKGKPPTISRTIGITEKELDQEAYRRLMTLNPDTVRDMKTLLTNNEVMRQEQLKILRQYPEISPQAKTIAENMIARGEALGRLPLREPILDWSKMAWGKEIPLGSRQQVMDLVDALPLEIKANIRAIEIGTPLEIKATAEYLAPTRTIRFKNIESLSEPATIYHEIAHNVVDSAFDRGEGTRLMQDYYHANPGAKNLKVDLDKLALAEDFRASYDSAKALHESFAEHFQAWVREPQLQAPWVGEFFEGHFPKRGSGLESINKFAQTIADQSIADITPVIQQLDSFKWMADGIEDTIIKNADDLMDIFQHYEVMVETAGNMPHLLMSNVMAQADELKRLGKFGALDELWRTNRDELSQLVSSIDTELERVRTKVLGNTTLLKPEQATALEELVERGTKLDVIRKSKLEQDRQLLNEFWSRPGKRTKEEHEAFMATRDLLWTGYRQEKAVAAGGEFWARKQYADLYYKMPPERLFPVDATDRALSRQDVAKVMGCNVDALTNGVTENVAMQDKYSFIQLIKQGADRRPDIFKGFTEEKIGQAYDSILHSINMTPDMSIANQKILMQVEDMKKRMINLKMLGSITPDEEKAMVGWVDNMADGLEKLAYEPGVAKPVIPEGKLPDAFIKATEADISQMESRLASQRLAVEKARSIFEQVIPPEAKLKVPRTGSEALETLVDISTVTPEMVEAAQALRSGLRTWVNLNDTIVGLKKFLAEAKAYKAPAIPKAKLPKVPTRVLKPEFKDYDSLRQSAWDKSMVEYYKVFADYTNQNIIDFVGKHIYPYWTYHLYRWSSLLPRTFLRRPGVGLAWGKYYDYTDRGYIHIPGTDLEANPFVGSGWGLTFGLARHDFKSYYESLGGAGEVLDATMRYGFYPGIHGMLPIVVSPLFSGRPPELGDILPPIGKTALELFAASNIPVVSQAAGRLKDKIFHDNFRDYYTATLADTMQAHAGGKLAGGTTGQDIWFKMQRKEPITDEEKELWDKASKAAGWIVATRSQFPFLRLRPEEYLDAYKDITTIIEQAYGISAKEQMEMWQHNMRPTDVVGGVDPDVEAAIDELWKWKLYLGRGAILAPPELGDLYTRMNEFWTTVEGYQLERQTTQSQLDTGLLTPTAEVHYNGREWRDEIRNKWEVYTNKFSDLKKQPKYGEIPWTTEQQAELVRKAGFSVPVGPPVDEALQLYFAIIPEIKADPYTGEKDYDWLRFYMKREAVRMALTEEQRGQFDSKIRKYETPLESKFRDVSNTYFRGYWAVRRIMLEEYPDEFKSLIAEFYADDTSMERKEEIRNVVTPKGRKLISEWETSLAGARERLREVSPQLDFYLYVFGYISKPKTKEATAMVNEWEKDKATLLTGEW